MTQKTIFAKTLEAVDDKARLDEACKQLLSNKMVLAWIMKHTMEEYADFEVNEIVEHYIEGKPKISHVTVHRNSPTDKEVGSINGDDTIDKTIEEGMVFFDIRFRAIFPRGEESITLLINVEAQNDFYPGYSLVKRGVYYCSHMISGQYGKEFLGKNYDEIKKVYSIWICINLTC